MLLLALHTVLTKTRRSLRVLRVVPFAFALVALVVTAKARAARAQAVSAALSMGREMENALPREDGRTVVRLNGERVIVGRLSEEASLHDVLDRLEKGCRDGGGTFARAWEIAGKHRPGIVREERAEEGLVVCIVRGESSAPTMSEALERFSKTHDLGAIGRVHYAYARAHGARTEVMTVETGDTFSFDQLAPPEGGAPGGSESVLPLPEKTQRILTAEVEASPFSMRVYRSQQSARAVTDFYATKLAALGFVPMAEGMYVRGGAQVIVMAREGAEPQETIVALAEAAN